MIVPLYKASQNLNCFVENSFIVSTISTSHCCQARIYYRLQVVWESQESTYRTWMVPLSSTVSFPILRTFSLSLQSSVWYIARWLAAWRCAKINLWVDNTSKLALSVGNAPSCINRTPSSSGICSTLFILTSFFMLCWQEDWNALSKEIRADYSTPVSYAYVGGCGWNG